MTGALNQEQARSLAEGCAHRARYYGWPEAAVEGDPLTLALAWWCAWWKERADRKEARRADKETGALFDDTGGTA